MFYFTFNESKIYKSFSSWNKLQEKKELFHHILIFLDVPVCDPGPQHQVFCAPSESRFSIRLVVSRPNIVLC